MLHRKPGGHYIDFYEPEPLVAENAFVRAKPDRSFPKNLPECRHLLPQPEWEGHESTIACYWRVWDLAFRNLKRVCHGNGFTSPYIDTAFNDCLFMWDSSFILMFARYGRRAWDFQRTLDNFYAKQHPDGFICREIQEWDGRDRFHAHDPVSTGPNVMPWCEWEYYLNFGDRARLARVFPPLLAYHRWTRKYRSWPDGSYWTTGFGCGMDNQPRTPAGYGAEVDHGHLSWIDATAQAAFSARLLVSMAKVLRRERDAKDCASEWPALSECVNRRMWSARTSFYYDRLRDGRLSAVKTVGAYWTLIAGLVPKGRAGAFVAHLGNPKEFKRPHRVPTLSADHPEYRRSGGYWLGAVWPPTNYMVLRGLTAAGRDGLAADIGRNHVDNATRVFEKTGTVWENYAPESANPGNPARKDFVGWSGLGPVAVLLEYVFGLRADVPSKRLVWDIRLTDAHGIRRYPFGAGGMLDLACGKRSDPWASPLLSVKSNVPLLLEVRWAGGKRTIRLKGD